MGLPARSVSPGALGKLTRELCHRRITAYNERGPMLGNAILPRWLAATARQQEGLSYMTPRSADDRYREARGLIEDLIAAWPGDPASELLIIAQRYIQTHCQQCGRALVGQARAQEDVICRTCQPTQRESAQPTSEEPSAVAIGPPPPPGTLETFDAACDRWPERIRPTVQTWWDNPAIQALRHWATESGLTLPLRGDNGQHGIRNDRLRALADPSFQQLLVNAARSGIDVRTLAAVLFGTTPGKASDDIARAIDACDPTARKNRRR
jgi:hypothetical protein